MKFKIARGKNMFINILNIIDILEYIFDVFIGFDKVNYNEKDAYILNVFFMNNLINKIFLAFIGLAIVLLLVFIAISLAKRYIGNTKKTKTVGKILGISLKSIALMCIIPICSVIVINTVSIVLREVVSLTEENKEKNYSIGTLLYLNFTMGLEKDEQFSIKPSFDDDLRKEYLTGNKTYAINGTEDFFEEKIDYAIVIPICLMMLVIILICAITFCMKIFELLLLYIVAPFFVATIQNDEGQKFFKWCKIFISKLITSFSMVVLVKIFFIIIPLVMKSNIVFSENTMTNLLVRSTFIVGGLWATYEFSKLINETFESKEEKSVLKDILKSKENSFDFEVGTPLLLKAKND